MKKRSDHCAKAQKYYQNGDLKNSLESLSRCIKSLTKTLRESATDKEMVRFQLARVYHFEGMVNLQLNRAKKAEQSFNKSLQFIDKIPSNDERMDLKGDILFSLSMIYVFTNRDPAEIYVQAKEAFVEAKNYESAVKVMFQQVNNEQSLQKQLEAYREIKKSSKKIKDKKIRKFYEAKAVLQEGKILHHMGDKDALNTIMKAKKMYSKLKDEKGLIDVMVEQAAMIEDLSQSEDLLIEALDLAKITGSPETMGMVLTKLGILSLKLGKFKKGKNRLLKGLKYRTEAGDKDGAAQTLLELSKITLISARENEDIQNAVNLIKQSLDLYSATGNEYGLASAHEMASTIYTSKGEYMPAVKHAKEGRKIFHRLKDKPSEARILAQLGVALDGNGDTHEVVPVFEKSIKLFSELSSLSGQAEVNYLLGLHLIKIDKIQSLKHMNNSLSIYDELRKDNSDMETMYTVVSHKIKEIEQI